MVSQVIKNIFENVYRDDYRDSDGFHRILFNNGRAVQARELNQLQTIMQKQVTRMGNNIFVDGAAVEASSLTVRSRNFVKLDTSVNSVSNINDLIGLEFTGATSGIKGRVKNVAAAEGSDPATIYVQYTTGKSDGSYIYFEPGEDLTSGSTTITVQTTNTTANPAIGHGILAGISEGVYYVQEQFIFVPATSKIVSKYSDNISDDLGFVVSETIITADDDSRLYDNAGEVVNTASPGADRYKITVDLALRSSLVSDENFVFVGTLQSGQIIQQVDTTEDAYNKIRDVIAKRTKEESGDYVVSPFKILFENDSADDTLLNLRISPGVAYVDGYRVARDITSFNYVNKPRTTVTANNEVVAFNIGNYVVVNGNKGLPNINTREQVNLRSATGHGGSTIGTARVRAVEEDTGSNYKVYLFDIQMNSGQNFRTTRSIGTSSSNYFDLVLEVGQAVLKDPTINNLLFSLPRNRPDGISDISLAVQRRFSQTSTAGVRSRYRSVQQVKPLPILTIGLLLKKTVIFSLELLSQVQVLSQQVLQGFLQALT